MLYQRATVVEITENTLSLETERQSSCGQCHLKKGCGTGLLNEHVGKRFSQITVEKTVDVKPGQQVSLSIPEQNLLRGAAFMYLLPLLMLFLFAISARSFNFNAVTEIFLGLLGLISGFLFVKKYIESKNIGLKAELVEEKK